MQQKWRGSRRKCKGLHACVQCEPDVMLGKAISCENDKGRPEERLCGCGVVHPPKIKTDIVEALHVEIDQVEMPIDREAEQKGWRDTELSTKGQTATKEKPDNIAYGSPTTATRKTCPCILTKACPGIL